MKTFMMTAALAACLLGGHGVANAADVYTCVNDTVPEKKEDAQKNGRGLGGLLGSFLGGMKGNNAKGNDAKTQDTTTEQVENPGKSNQHSAAKEAIGGILGSVLGGNNGQNGGNGGKVGDVLGSIFNELPANKLSAEMLVGTWDYSSSKFVLKADDIVKKMGSEAMVAPLEKKMNGYLARVGFKPGSFSYTFNADGTFTAVLNGRPMKGNYILDVENKTLQLNFFKVVKTNLSLTVVNQQLGMLHDADKLLDLVRGIAAKSSSSSVKGLNTILSRYNGLQIGMEFQKVK